MKKLKKVAKPISIKIPPIRLFLEDVEAIEEVYKEYCKEYKITTDEYELDCTEDLRKIEKDKLGELCFESSEPHIVVDFHPSRASIYSSDSSVISTGVVSKIRAILAKRTTPLRYFAKFWLVIVMTGAVALSLPLFGKILPNIEMFPIMAFSVLGILICWIVWAAMFEDKYYSLIYLKTRSSQKNFFLRNKDQVLLSIFSAFLGAAMSFLVLWAMGKLKF